jgi:DHA1 family bicyclomycin/chloramphenicol resistance-like MFS transporter
LVFAFGSIFFGFIINKYDPRKMLFVSGVICTLGLIIIVVVTLLNSPSPLIITLAFLPFSIGSIIPCTILYPMCLNFMPQAKGKVSALFQGGRLMLTALGLELAGYCYQGSFRNIGIIIIFFIVVGIISLFYVVKDYDLIKSPHGEIKS